MQHGFDRSCDSFRQLDVPSRNDGLVESSENLESVRPLATSSEWCASTIHLENQNMYEAKGCGEFTWKNFPNARGVVSGDPRGYQNGPPPYLLRWNMRLET